MCLFLFGAQPAKVRCLRPQIRSHVLRKLLSEVELKLNLRPYGRSSPQPPQGGGLLFRAARRMPLRSAAGLFQVVIGPLGPCGPQPPAAKARSSRPAGPLERFLRRLRPKAY